MGQWHGCGRKRRCCVQEKTVRVGLVGFGTVGTGVAKLICDDGDAIAAKTGVRLELGCVVDVDTARPREVSLPDGVLTNDLNRLLLRTRSLIVIDWRFNREIHAVIRRYRVGMPGHSAEDRSAGRA